MQTFETDEWKKRAALNSIDVCCTFLRDSFRLLDANPIKMKGRLSSEADGGVAGHYQSTIYKMKNTVYRSIVQLI